MSRIFLAFVLALFFAGPAHAATLAELKQIQFDSNQPAEDELGNPAPAAVLSAIALLGKIEVAIWKEAQQRISGVGLPTGNTPEENQIRNEAIGWAQQAINSAENVARTALKLLLAANAGATSAQILAAPDATIESQIDALIPLLARGSHPGRR